MASVTLGAGAEALKDYLLNGKTSGTAGSSANGKEGFTALLKGLAGDYVLSCSPSTATKAPTSSAWSQTVTVSLKTAAGEVHTWYNGPVKLAVADTSSAGTASISPSAGNQMMTDGTLTVTLSGNAANWLNGETATLTVAVPDTTAIGGWTTSSATCVVTFSNS